LAFNEKTPQVFALRRRTARVTPADVLGGAEAGVPRSKDRGLALENPGRHSRGDLALSVPTSQIVSDPEEDVPTGCRNVDLMDGLRIGGVNESGRHFCLRHPREPFP